MACGQLPMGGCDHPNLGHEGPCINNLIVLEPSEVGKQDKWFIADERQYEGQEYPWWCVHGGTVSHANLERNLRWVTTKKRNRKGVMVFQARNRTQVRDWLREHGKETEYNPAKERAMEQLTTNQAAQVMPGRAQAAQVMPGRAEFLQRRIDRMQEELDYIASLPGEPTGTSDGTNVIFFEKVFTGSGGSRTYSYAAVKAGDGLWYTTGLDAPKCFTWDELIQWIYADGGVVDDVVWAASEFSAL